MLTRDSMLLLRTNYYHHATKLKSGKGKPALLNTEDCMPWLKFKGLESNNQVSLKYYVQHTTLESGINVSLRLLIFGIFLRATVLLRNLKT